MVLTQKVTSLAFSLHDGLARTPEDLTPFQKQQLIRKVPNPLEYYSYVFHFHAVMVGPTVLFADYTDFINGKHFSKRSHEGVIVANLHRSRFSNKLMNSLEGIKRVGYRYKG
jgi:lysophospholipid acyltransferase 1/2